MSSVRTATLNDGEIQSLIEILLNKQGQGATLPSTEWKVSSHFLSWSVELVSEQWTITFTIDFDQHLDSNYETEY